MPSHAHSQLESDLEKVYALLQAGLNDLTGPLGELVRPQLQTILPLVRAGAVLTTASALRAASPSGTSDTPSGSPSVLSLAAAVEMLYIALTLHTRLVQPATRNSPSADPANGVAPSEKTLLGGTILAGDYCFSRASQLAAQTENPAVVGHFARTLQLLSEGLLRTAFDAVPPGSAAPVNSPNFSSENFDEKRTLLLAGVEGTLLLHGYPVPDSVNASASSSTLSSTSSPTALPAVDAATVSLHILEQARTFADWLADSVPTGGNGYHTTAASFPSLPATASGPWSPLYTWRQNAAKV